MNWAMLALGAGVLSLSIQYSLALRRLSRAYDKLANAYQIIGVLHAHLDDTAGWKPVITEEEWGRALTHLARPEIVDDNFLPWPRQA